MKAITIIQPWATLIAILEKGNETRKAPRPDSTTPARRSIGKHARCQKSRRLVRHGYSVDNLPTGAVVAIANLTECWSIGTDYQSGMPRYTTEQAGKTSVSV